jgi:hypothetical protein
MISKFSFVSPNKISKFYLQRTLLKVYLYLDNKNQTLLMDAWDSAIMRIKNPQWLPRHNFRKLPYK